MDDEPPDLTNLLNEWNYDENNNIRFIFNKRGKKIMQVRQPLGIEQYYMDDRPDGVKINGEKTVLDYLLWKKKKTLIFEDQFTLTDQDFDDLREEGLLFYFRYLIFYQMGHYKRVVRDTKHNLGIAGFLKKYYHKNRKNDVLQYYPYIRRINAIARAMIELNNGDMIQAILELDDGRYDIKVAPIIPTHSFEIEKDRSLQHLNLLKSWIENMGTSDNEITGLREQLSEELHQAVEVEDYETAARLRDQLRRLK